MSDQTPTFMIEGARIIFRNFSGVAGQFNRDGDRNFAVIIPEDVVDQLLADGWNVKRLKPRDEEDTPDAYITVSVSYKMRPPRVVLLTSRSRSNIGEDGLEILDWAELGNVDLICNAYDWTVNGKTGRKAYLKSFFATLSEDPLELKYGINEPPAHHIIPEE